MFNRKVIIKFQYEAIHKWQDVTLPTIMYLAHPHRHLFHITCWKKVSHGDREVEVITFKQQVIEHLKEHFAGDFRGMSCEHIAEHLVRRFVLESCEVLEDGENGAVVSRNAQDEPPDSTNANIH